MLNKKYLILFFLFLFSFLSIFAQNNPNHVWVKGYYRSSGTYVKGHWRTAPNSTNTDNFSTLGNVNPYTGKKGWIRPDDKANPWAEKEEEVKEVEVESYNTYFSTTTIPSDRIENETVVVNKYTSTSTADDMAEDKESKDNINTSFRSQKWVSTGDRVNVRNYFSLQATVNFILDKGDEVEVLQKSRKQQYVDGYGTDYWYKINFAGKEGWVFGKLLKALTTENVNIPNNWKGTILTIKGNNVNVREEPTTKRNNVSFQLFKTNKVEVIAKSKTKYTVEGYGADYWYYIKHQGRFGWVFGKLTQ